MNHLIIQPSTKTSGSSLYMLIVMVTRTKDVAKRTGLACSFASGAMLIHKYILPIVINV
jgi:hypothetical protein